MKPFPSGGKTEGTCVIASSPLQHRPALLVASFYISTLLHSLLPDARQNQHLILLQKSKPSPHPNTLSSPTSFSSNGFHFLTFLTTLGCRIHHHFFFMEADSAAIQDPPSVLDALCISAFDFLEKSYACIRSSLSDQNPLFSIFVTFYALVLLYLPHLFLSLFCSPVLISTAILLASILQLGASQKTQPGKDDNFCAETEKADTVDESPIAVELKPAAETEEIDAAVATKPHFSEPFVEWSRRGPLEVIYEEYEGEEEAEDSPENERRRVGLDRLLSLSLYYPDSDDSSDGEFPEDFPAWDSPEHLCFRWEEEREEGLIEIPLCGKQTAGFHVEEENLIEIDLSIPEK